MKTFSLAAIAVAATMLAAPVMALSEQDCFARCKAMQSEFDALLDSTDDNATMSGTDTRAMSEMQDQITLCNAQCAELGTMQNIFAQCIENAHQDEYLINLCRENYLKDRPDHSW